MEGYAKPLKPAGDDVQFKEVGAVGVDDLLLPEVTRGVERRGHVVFEFISRPGASGSTATCSRMIPPYVRAEDSSPLATSSRPSGACTSGLVPLRVLVHDLLLSPWRGVNPAASSSPTSGTSRRRRYGRDDAAANESMSTPPGTPMLPPHYPRPNQLLHLALWTRSHSAFGWAALSFGIRSCWPCRSVYSFDSRT